VVDYITKPFKSGELVEIVDEYFLYLSWYDEGV
jgi:FixJ family two-component response regulator